MYWNIFYFFLVAVIAEHECKLAWSFPWHFSVPLPSSSMHRVLLRQSTESEDNICVAQISPVSFNMLLDMPGLWRLSYIPKSNYILLISMWNVIHIYWTFKKSLFQIFFLFQNYTKFPSKPNVEVPCTLLSPQTKIYHLSNPTILRFTNHICLIMVFFLSYFLSNRMFFLLLMKTIYHIHIKIV